MYEKRCLGCVFSCHDRMVPTVSVCSVSRKCRTIPFFGRFLESCYIAHPRSRVEVSENPVRGCEIGGKTAFCQEKMSHDSKFAPKIGIVLQNSSFPSGVSYLLAGSLGMVSAISLVFGRWNERLGGGVLCAAGAGEGYWREWLQISGPVKKRPRLEDAVPIAQSMLLDGNRFVNMSVR